MQIKRTIGFMVPNYFGSDPGAMAAWHSAAHVEEAPKPTTPKKAKGKDGSDDDDGGPPPNP